MWESCRGLGVVARVVLVGCLQAGAAGGCKDSSGQPGEGVPIVPEPKDEIISGADGGVEDGGGWSLPTDLAMPNAPAEIAGTETPVSDKYWPRGVDLGEVDPDESFRALVVLQLRNPAELVARIDGLYDPASPSFRRYLATSEVLARYAPTEATVNEVKGWLTGKGLKIDRTAGNRLLISYSGTVGQFNAAFNTRLHLIRRSETTWRAPAYAPLAPLECFLEPLPRRFVR